MKVYILHHDDSDGYCAAAAFKYFGEKYFNDVEYHAVDYGRKLPIMEDNSTVYILDYSISLEELNALVERMDNVLILDHHASALKRLLGHENAYIDITRSGAMIAFEYFRQKFGLVYHDVPEFVKYVQDQDLGLFKLPDSVEVKNYIYSIPLTIQDYYDHFWIDISYMIDRGITITHYVNTLMENAVKNAVVVVIDGHRCLMINTAILFSDLGSFLFKYMEQFDCQITGAYYRLNDESIKFSLRSNSNFDVSILAEKFGGGGHKKAAGFEIPFEHFDGRKLICE